jgi:hypothetical protein
MNNYHSNAGVAMNMATFSKTSLKTQIRRRTMEKARNNPEKEEQHSEKKAQGTKRKTLQKPRSKETHQKQ